MNTLLDEAASMLLTHVNLRTEKHGPDDAPAIDLKFKWVTSNRALAHFHPGLQEALYRTGETLDGLEQVRSALVFPQLHAVRWDEELTGLRLTIDHGMGGRSDLVLLDCIADKFAIDPLEGGTVEITFRVRTTYVDEKVLGRLGGLLGHEMPIRLEQQHPVHSDDAAPPSKAKGKRKQQRELVE